MITLLKTENCNEELINFASKVTFDYIQQQNNNNILCSISQKLSPELLDVPKMYYSHNLDTIYCLEFAPGQDLVYLKELHYNFDSVDTDERYVYMQNLILDKHRVWSTSTLTCKDEFDYDNKLSNQMLTLLRICKIDKTEYIKNPKVLSMKFK